MKKIFLTSGMIVCMACPAFATGTGFPADTQTGTVPSGIQSGACTEPKLGVYEGSTTLSAIWQNNTSTINLDMNTAANGALASGASVSPTPIYGIPSDTSNVYEKTGDDYSSITQLGSVTDGKTVTFTLNDNKPSTASTTVTSGTASTEERLFTGFWSAATGGTQYIKADKTVLAAGKTAAAGYAAGSTNTWYAQYDCATPTLTDPSLTGYTFKGWSATATGNSTDNPITACINDTTEIYATWSANDYTISYSCTGEEPAGAGTATGTITNQTVTFDQSYTLNDGASCSLSGYTFAGWKCNNDLPGRTKTLPDAQNATYYAASGSASWTRDGDVSCKAMWTANEIEITWDDNDGDDTTTATGGTPSCFYGADVTLPTAPTRTGYTFQGWEVSNN